MPDASSLSAVSGAAQSPTTPSCSASLLDLPVVPTRLYNKLYSKRPGFRMDSSPIDGTAYSASYSCSILLLTDFCSLPREPGAPQPTDRCRLHCHDEIARFGNSGPCRGNLIDFIPCYTTGQHKQFFQGLHGRNFPPWPLVHLVPFSNQSIA